jgi:hypothetical protein
MVGTDASHLVGAFLASREASGHITRSGAAPSKFGQVRLRQLIYGETRGRGPRFPATLRPPLRSRCGRQSPLPVWGVGRHRRPTPDCLPDTFRRCSPGGRADGDPRRHHRRIRVGQRAVPAANCPLGGPPYLARKVGLAQGSQARRRSTRSAHANRKQWSGPGVPGPGVPANRKLWSGPGFPGGLARVSPRSPKSLVPRTPEPLSPAFGQRSFWTPGPTSEWWCFPYFPRSHALALARPGRAHRRFPPFMPARLPPPQGRPDRPRKPQRHGGCQAAVLPAPGGTRGWRW